MIPRFDLRAYADDKSRFAEAFGTALHDFGFVRLTGHGIPSSILKAGAREARKFFSQPQEVKKRHEVDSLRGIMSYSKDSETARGAEKADIKEEWCIRTRLPQGHDMAHKVDDLLTVPELPLFKPSICGLFGSFENVTLRVMEPLALYMGLEENWFADKFNRSHSTMRLLHYPQGGNAANHLDLNFLTWLKAEEPGLYVTARDGREYPGQTEGDELILNGGMQLGLLTNNDIKPSWHRVEASQPRHTIVFFAHPNPDFRLEPVGRFAGNPPVPRPDYFPPLNATGGFSIPVEDFVKQEVNRIYIQASRRQVA